MYLKELRLHGFKSFADPTRLELQRGVTAIVGPNGCGKSNIADAIRWVLGEQSPKSLRAGGMQDVIFQGTTARKPVNLCEVSLVFADCEDALGTAHHEVEVGRRVVRDGPSEYFLNGRPCRLKDIQNLFLDTGIGHVSYSFMLQGQIDQILSSNPAERRALFEEAAGISKYKAQRREALAKLAQVDANLARVSDVMEEVARQTGSLKRQAAKALRYQRIHYRLARLDLARGGFRHAELLRETRAGRARAELLEREMAALARALAESEQGLAARRERALELRRRLDEAQKRIYDLRADKENAAGRAAMADLRAEDLAGRLDQIAAELERLAHEERQLAEKLAGETRLKQEQMDLFGGSDELFQKRSRELAELQTRLNQAETELSRHKQALLVREGAITRLRSNCTGLELDLKTYQVRHANLAEELRALEEGRQLLARDRDTLAGARAARQQDLAKQQAKLEELKGRQQELTHGHRECQRAIQETERQRAGVQAQIAVLQELQARLEGFSEGARAILQGRLAELAPKDSVASLPEHLKVAEGLTAAVELLLGAAGDGVFLRDRGALRPLVQALADKPLGRASLLTVPANGSHGPGRTGQPLPGLLPAAEAVSSADPEVQAFLNTYLEGCYIADDLDAFLARAEATPGFAFRLVVTPKGEVADARGLVLAGSAAARKENSSYLARQSQLRKLGRELAGLDDSLERLRLEADQAQRKLDAAEKRIEEQRRLLAETGAELATLAAQLEAAERGLEANRRAAAAKSAELQQLEATKEQSTRRLAQARAELEAAEGELDEHKRRITEAEEQAAALRAQREALREQFDEVRFEVAQKRQRLEILDRGLAELQRRSRETAQTRIQRQEETVQLRAQIEALKAEAAAHRQAEAAADAALAAARAELEADRAALQEVELQIAATEEGLAPQRDQQQRLAAEHNQIEVALARQESRLQFIREECEREYQRDPAEIDWLAELWKAGDALPERIRVDLEDASPEDLEALPERADPTPEQRASLEPVDWAAVEAEAAALRTRLQAMGPVNLVSIAEYKELKERHAFLAAQSADLWKAKEQLLQAIDEINTTSQQMFAGTFARIRENFHYTFTTLFGGGRADLALIDEGDVLESGIEITAQPPGTRLRSLALLSGGQKAMTAVALLFAIYMVKPSPFCVLDEIDAPLDDANIGRFTDMLRGFLQYSQFFIITHNKRTISVADTIFGATMPEKGVTRLVSLRFNKATGETEARPA